MRILYSAILILFICNSHAQHIDNVKLRIHYTSKSYRFETSKNKTPDEKILDIGIHISKFYSLWETKIEATKDSVISRGGSFQDVMNALGHLAYPRSYEYYTVYKNYPEKGKLTYTDKVFKHFIYEEALDKPKWNMILQDTLIAGYKCQKARTQFRGRTWDVWFAPAISISDGPWKLCGLPGLILMAKDSKGDFIFECIEIKNIENEWITFSKQNYIKCATWKELNLMKTKSGKDPTGYLNQFGVESGQGFGTDGRPLVNEEKKAVLLEY